MILNLLIIAVIIAAIAWIGYRYVNTVSEQSDDEFMSDDYHDLITIKEKVSKEFSAILKQDLREKNMTRKEYVTRQKQKAALRKNLKDAANGDSQAKRYIKTYIKSMLVDPAMNFNIDENTIDEIIPFGQERELKNEDKFEILLYVAYNKLLDKKGMPYKQLGFAKIIKEYHLTDPIKVNGEMCYDLTEERLNDVYSSIMSQVTLTYNDKLEIVAQRVFEMYKGFGVADSLFETSVDEVDGGISGVPKDGFEITHSSKELTYSYQAIWVIIGGIKLHLSCIGFGSQEELVRVVNNIYKYGANRVLNRSNGYVISVMKSGSRVVVMRPPFSTSYAFLARKFDSTPSVAPEDLISKNGEYSNAIIPLTLIKWLIRGQRNIAITGSQGTGKSTFLKSVIRFIDAAFSLRVQEKTSELNLNYTYPNRSIIAFQETESIDSQEGLNLQKKTSGDVNVVGEVAEAIQANFVIQTAMVASLFALFTHHAKTTYDLVMSIANNLLDPIFGIYREQKEAVEMAAKVLNIDIHLENRKGHRYLERITEVMPVQDRLYPSEVAAFSHERDELEFWKRTTDRKLFEENQLMHFENGEFVLDNLPSEAMMEEIKKKLTYDEEAEFLKDMEMIRNLQRQKVTEDVFEKAPKMLDPDMFETEPIFDELQPSKA